MIPKPKYIEDILSIVKEKRGFLHCDVVCKCGSNHFIGYENILVRSDEEIKYEKDLIAFHNKYNRITFGNENGIPYMYGMKNLFGDEIVEKFENKSFDSTVIIKVKCATCGKVYILFDSRFHGYDALIPERISEFDNIHYEFKPIVWKKDIVGEATFTVAIQNDESLEEFIDSAYETDEETYSNSFGWIKIKAKNIKTKATKTLVDLETA